MKSITKRANLIWALITAFFIGLGILMASFAVNGDQWATNLRNGHLYQNGRLKQGASVLDRNGMVLSSTADGKTDYSSDYAVRLASLHAVGDPYGRIASSVHSLYRSEIAGYSFTNGVYRSIINGKNNTVSLTIDAEITKTAYQAMNGNKGTVAVYNYKTGEIICMTSSPTYDPENPPSDLTTNEDRYDGVYINRFLGGVFTPGSTFKVLTAICAIDNIKNVRKRSFTCNGTYELSGGSVICNNRSGHGTLTFQRALNVSCNCVFAELAAELGSEKLTETARQLGFFSPLTVSRANVSKSYLDLDDATALNLGWAGIGQHTTLVNPCRMLMLVGAIANGGTSVTPYFVQTSSLLQSAAKTYNGITINESTNKVINNLLRSNVRDYYGDNRFPGLEFCGKTGSAEVANEKSHAWFYGYSRLEDFPYAVVVCLENGGMGYNDALPVASKVMAAMREAGY